MQHRTRMSDRVLAGQVRLQCAGHDLGARAVAALERRAGPLLDDDERGAQAAEYAMVGGVGAACCVALIEFLRRGGIERFWDTVVGTFERLLQRWIS